MSSLLPPAGTYQPEQPFTMRPESHRARTNSATAEKYRPRTYSNPPPTQPDPSLLGPHQHPYAPPDPSLYPQQPQPQPPYPQQGIYPQTHAQTPIPMPVPMPVPQPSYLNPPKSILKSTPRHGSYDHAHDRPPMDEDSSRRHSYSSQVSRHSHDSRRSHDSKHSRHSRHSGDDKHHDGHSHSHGSKKDHPHRTNERPTMGDSLVSMFGLIKSALGPRDK
jgi:hypothetical protein